MPQECPNRGLAPTAPKSYRIFVGVLSANYRHPKPPTQYAYVLPKGGGSIQELLFQWPDLDFSGMPMVSVRLDEKGAAPEGALNLIEEARGRCVGRADVDHIVIETSEIRFADAD